MNVTSPLDLSIVLPCFNEKGCVEALAAEIAGVVLIVMDSDQQKDPADIPRLLQALRGHDVSDAACTYRAIRGDALREVLVFNGMHRFLPTVLRLQGLRISEIEVNHPPRTTGKSKYGIGNRISRGIADCFAIRWYRKCVLPAHRTARQGA